MTKTIKRHTSPHHRKRQGQHQKRTKDFHRVYLPYLPLVVAIVASIFISGWRPNGATLAYATEMSRSSLLASTNTQRSGAGKSSLALNSKLNNAAQAKANDMIARDYWSHNTPDGQAPWVFVQNAGYSYSKAGENLAYGFTTSSGTINGWMNSASHKANMLDGEFKEVGFGFANSADFNDAGQQTVVVAMYGKPQTLASTDEQTATPAPVKPKAVTPAPTAASKPVEAKPAEQPAPKEVAEKEEEPTLVAYTTDTAGLEPLSSTVPRVAAIAGGNADWAVFVTGLAVGLGLMAFLLKHIVGFRKFFRQGEKFILHHPLFDSAVLGLLIIGVTLLQTTGVIK